jgi:hypothetical protein
VEFEITKADDIRDWIEKVTRYQIEKFLRDTCFDIPGCNRFDSDSNCYLGRMLDPWFNLVI